jgi:hypothetical protein
MSDWAAGAKQIISLNKLTKKLILLEEIGYLWDRYVTLGEKLKKYSKEVYARLQSFY